MASLSVEDADPINLDLSVSNSKKSSDAHVLMFPMPVKSRTAAISLVVKGIPRDPGKRRHQDDQRKHKAEQIPIDPPRTAMGP